MIQIQIKNICITQSEFTGAARIFRAAPNVMDWCAAERRKFFQARAKILLKGKDLQSDVSRPLNPFLPAHPP